MLSIIQPPTEAEWVEVGNGFSRRWQFPNCLGAVDGKHVAITCPKDSGSTYYNYKVCLWSLSPCLRYSLVVCK